MATNEKWKVLVVEDNDTTRKIVAAKFRKHSFEVTETYDGSKALEYLGLGEDGEDTGSGKSSRKDIPVAIMSAYEGQERIERCKAEGALAYIIKPVTDEHINHLRSLIEGSKV